MKMRQQAKWYEALIMNKGYPGRRAHIPHQVAVPVSRIPDEWKRKTPAKLPEVSELELVRHVVRLSQMNHGVDVGPYLLGSCTMKYNPKINERIARFDGFAQTHPDAPDEAIQGTLEVVYRLQEVVRSMTGFDEVTVQPAAGAQGEYVGMMITKAYHQANGDKKRNKVLIPDSAHGTNPASAAMAGFKVLEIPSTLDGYVDLEVLEAALDDSAAALMITNPNTLGIFEPNILKITEMVHKAGALTYLDGANYNGIVGIVKPADMGFDIMHLNMHKTFSGPHGGGGPGCGPVGVISKLAKFLPKPIVRYKSNEDKFYLDHNLPNSIGRVHPYFGNFGIILRTLAFVYRNGGEGIRKMCEAAVLNANYLMTKVSKVRGFDIPKAANVPRKHEFIAAPITLMKETGINAGDVAKALLEYGIHSPTIYFPLIVKEAMLIEPTEAESRDTLDEIANAFAEISKHSYNNPKLVHEMPQHTSRSRLDEYGLAKKPVLSERQRSN